MHAAHTDGFAPHNRSNGELAIAFRPDFLGTYIDNLESLHACGKSSNEIEMLAEIATDPGSVADSTIEDNVAKDRQFAVFMTKRALRELDFRDRILTAYGHQCAMCGIQLNLLDAAHILPVVQASHHDGGLASFTKALRPLLILPPDKKDRPNPAFIKESNRLRGW